MPLLIIVLPRTESSMKVLERVLLRPTLKYRDVALPVPRELCLESLSGEPQLKVIEKLRTISGALTRLWEWVPNFMKTLLKLDPSININCYLSLDKIEESANTAIELARLVLKAKLGGSIDVHEWLSAIEHETRTEIFPKNAVAILDNYPLYLGITKHFSVDIVALGPFIPTPVDLLYLIRKGLINDQFINDVIHYVIKYIGYYVIYSRNLTEAYQKLLSDNDYRSLIKNLGLRIIA